MEYLDPNWTIANDKQSVHVGINTRIWLCNKQKRIPTLIKLGREHTEIFLKEKHWPAIPKEPQFYKSGSNMIPIEFNSSGIYGIAIESTPKPTPANKVRKRADS